MRPKITMRPGIRPHLLAAITMLGPILGLGACATRPPASNADALAEYHQANDPLEPTNRVFFQINNGIDTVIIRPAAVAYGYVPAFVRNPIHNVLDNISSPVTFADDVTQAKPRRAGDTFMRFVINSTAGVAGVFDVATGWGYPAHETDFGVTLALWGLPDGPYLFLPVLGPSSPRDALGFGVDTVIDPFFWPPNGHGWNTFRISREVIAGIDARQRVLNETDQIQKTALDPYATYRSLYRQHRASVIQAARDANQVTVPDWYPSPHPAN